jgi:hypothetical protein
MPQNKKNKAFIYVLLLCLLYMGGQQRVWGQDVYPPGRGWDDVDYGYPKVVVPPDIPLKQRVKAASAVFEGRVVDRYKITTENEKEYTCYVVQVYRIFKGNFVADTVEVITFTDSDTYRKSFSQTESLWTYGISVFFTEPTTKFNTFTQSTRKKFQFYSPYYGHIEEIERLKNTDVLKYDSSQEIQALHKSIAKYARKKPKVVKEIYKKNCP